MTSTAVIEIPLLANRIYHNLPAITRKACLSVNKSWYAAFLPLLYKKIVIPQLKKSELVETIVHGIKLQGHLIRELDLSQTFYAPADTASPDRLLEVLAENCQQLRALKIKLVEKTSWPLLAKFLHSNVNLVELELDGVANKDTDCSLPDLFKHMSKLERLVLSNVNNGIPVGDLLTIGRYAPRLSRLHVQSRILPDKEVEASSSPASDDDTSESQNEITESTNNANDSVNERTPVFPILKYMQSMQGSGDSTPLEKVVRQCPSLETLRLSISEWIRLAPVVNALGVDRVCPHLTTIEFDGSLRNAESDLVRLIRCLPPMQSIKLTAIDASLSFMKALIDRHASELKTLKLLNLNQCSDEGIHELMVRSTKLEQLMVQPWSRESSPVALDARVLLSSPWGCKNLSWLYLPMGWPVDATISTEERQTIQDDGPFIELERQFYKQLSELPHLWFLLPEGDQSTSIGFSWTLARGFGQTSTLTSLKYLVRFQTKELGKDEKEWIKSHWTALKMYN
ncbi:hypothetical protein BGW41_001421 [Actinomortierella wolfii]|nr:hypothetical protein BGW41_001421 [Actinomortierella wolfii]